MARSSKIMSAKEALAPVRDGATIMVGGFGLVGAPLYLIAELERTGVRDLTIISNNLGEPGLGLGRLLRLGRVKKAIGSFFTSNPDVVQAHARGELEVQLIPQGTLAEAIRAGGAGIGGFYTRTGVGTLLAEGKETRIIDGVEYVLERPLRADVALIKAHRADELGNLVYYKTARNFNPAMATAADWVVAQVDEVVPVGSLDPEAIATPHLFVDAIVVPEAGAGGDAR